MKHKRQNPEHVICRGITNWKNINEYRYPCLHWLRHWPNEGVRKPWIAKQVGIISGPSDYFLPVPTRLYHGLWLEVKAHGKKPTESQRKWLDDMAMFGFQSEWSDNLQGCIDILNTYAREATKHWKKELE